MLLKNKYINKIHNLEDISIISFDKSVIFFKTNKDNFYYFLHLKNIKNINDFLKKFDSKKKMFKIDYDQQIVDLVIDNKLKEQFNKNNSLDIEELVKQCFLQINKLLLWNNSWDSQYSLNIYIRDYVKNIDNDNYVTSQIVGFDDREKKQKIIN